MVFRFVVLQRRMRSPLFGLQISMFCLKLPQGFYYMSANSNDSGETVLMRRFVLTLQVAYMISTIFSCAGFIIITYVNQVCFETEII